MEDVLLRVYYAHTCWEDVFRIWCVMYSQMMMLLLNLNKPDNIGYVLRLYGDAYTNP